MNEDNLDRLFRGEIEVLSVACTGQIDRPCARPGLVVPGSFNPLHEGHRELARVAEEMVGQQAVYELSIINVDKPALTVTEVLSRARQFAGLGPVWLTRAPRFTEKARLFPGSVFAVGMDTAIRIVDARYHGGNEQALRESLKVLRRFGCRFLVAGRVVGSTFLSAGQLVIPAGFRDLFEVIAEDRFRRDISSTWLRQQGEVVR